MCCLDTENPIFQKVCRNIWTKLEKIAHSHTYCMMLSDRDRCGVTLHNFYSMSRWRGSQRFHQYPPLVHAVKHVSSDAGFGSRCLCTSTSKIKTKIKLKLKKGLCVFDDLTNMCVMDVFMTIKLPVWMLWTKAHSSTVVVLLFVSRQWDTFLGSAQEHNFTLSKRNVFIFPDDHQTGCLHVLTVVSSSSCEQLPSSHSCWMFLSTCDMFIVCIMSSQQGVKALPTLTVNERWKLSLSNPLRHQQNSFHTRAAELLSTTPASVSQTLPRSGTSQGFPWAAPNEHPIHSLVFFSCFS